MLSSVLSSSSRLGLGAGRSILRLPQIAARGSTDLGLLSSPPMRSMETSSSPPKTFASLLRNCPFTQMGNPKGKIVVGRIYHVVNDDLYIDIGHKFPIVALRPRWSNKDSPGKAFTRGSRVRVQLKRTEISELFLGYDKELTLCEADGVVLGVYEGGDSSGSTSAEDKKMGLSVKDMF